MLLGTFIRILTSLIRDFCTSDRNFASTFFQIPPHDGHPWSWLVVGHCDYNPHNRLSLSRYMPCPAYQKGSNPFDLNPLYYSIGQSQTIEVVSTSISVTTNGNCVWSTSIPYKINDNVCPLGIV